MGTLLAKDTLCLGKGQRIPSTKYTHPMNGMLLPVCIVWRSVSMGQGPSLLFAGSLGTALKTSHQGCLANEKIRIQAVSSKIGLLPYQSMRPAHRRISGPQTHLHHLWHPAKMECRLLISVWQTPSDPSPVELSVPMMTRHQPWIASTALKLPICSVFMKLLIRQRNPQLAHQTANNCA